MTEMKNRFRKKVITTLVMVAVLVVSIFCNAVPVKADVLQGLGTAADPFIITTAERLASIPSIGLDKYYKLANDIDLSTYGEWTPIGNSTNNFKGNFDGNGHKITGIKVGPSKYANTPYVGLFGCISGATITNLGVSAEIYSSGSNIGCLAGAATSSTITNCYSDSQLNCSGSNVGGLLGNTNASNIRGCHVSGTVAGLSNIGGLIGYMYNSNMYNSYCTGTVTGTGDKIGGIIGYRYVNASNNYISNCYSASNVNGKTGVGGFIGYNQTYAEQSAKRYNNITNCYATGNVTGNTYVGGFTGQSTQSKYNTSSTAVYTQVINCYSSGKVVGTSTAGGFSGYQQASPTITNSYWCYTNSPNTSLGVASNSGSCVLSGLADVDMKDKSFVETLNYNIYSLKLSGCAAWKIVATRNNGYPVLDGIGDGDTTDAIAPSGSYTLSTTASTSGEVTINFSATDDNSGVKSITHPDGTVVEATTTTYVVNENGKYNFIVTDNAGNTSTIGVIVSNIVVPTVDITAPSGTYTLSTIASTAGPVTICFNGADDGSGIKSITLPDNTVVSASSATYTVSENGTYNFIVTDNSGNTAIVSVIVSNIISQTVDITAPSGTYTLSTIASTAGPVTIYFNAADDGSGIKSITLPDNTIVFASSATYTVSANGTYKFIVTDNAGNTAPISVPVTNIAGSTLDVTAPSAAYTLSPTEAGSVTIKIYASDDNSGVKSITMPDTTIVNATTAVYTVKATGTYKFVITDKSGNNTVLSVEVPTLVPMLDQNKPTGTYTLSTTAITAGSVTISLVGTDEGSGVNSIILPNGSVVTAASVTYTVSANGVYNFAIIDNAGNTKTIPVTVSNISTSSDIAVTPVNIVANDGSNVTIIINISGSTTISAMKWSSGTKDVDYFKTGGTDFTDNSFSINANGTYTVYIEDASGSKVIKTFTVSNINSTDNPTTEIPSDDMDLSDIPSVVDIVMSKSSSYAITAFGEVYSWGYNNCGQLGLGNTKATTTPTKINGLSDVCQIVVNDDYSVYAITVYGDVYSWGYNNYGQLGIGNTKTTTKPVKISGLTNVTNIIVKGNSVFAFTSDSETFAWGNNTYGKLGIKGAKIITKPTKVSGLAGF